MPLPRFGLTDGLVYFWFLNDDCRMERLRPQLEAFANGGAKAVVLHARLGLLVPYASDEWFRLINQLVDECVKLGLQPWLYDEDYCPSGNAGGFIFANHPELEAKMIEQFVAPADLKPGELFFFPTGNIIWAGLVPPTADRQGANAPVELTGEAGIVRRYWEAAPWDSRFYYDDTPLYDCPRSEAYHSEWAIRVPAMKPGWRLVAFVARPCGRRSPWGGLADSLNPRATDLFIKYVYERYAQALGSKFGREVPAIFTDEPKFFSPHPYTDGLFESFQQQYGYDLRPRLDHLFSLGDDPAAMRTRLDYRNWCAKRFEDAWLAPLARWCKDKGIALVGHMSPEECPIDQSKYLGNLLPLQKHFELPGLDLIVPAIGDARHPMLNVGVVSINSTSQQLGAPGVMSETLGASGLDMETTTGARVLAWQVLSGVSTIVIHAAFGNTLGLRLIDAPPDCGPAGPRWDGMCQISRELGPFIELITDATQSAPVALLWPIRSFNAMVQNEQDKQLRARFHNLLLACLEAQAHVHVLDEATLHEATIAGGRITIGKASYSHVVVPPLTVLAQRTVERLREAASGGIAVHAVGQVKPLVDDGKALKALNDAPWKSADPNDQRQWCIENLPSALPLADRNAPWLRSNVWTKRGVTTALLMNIDAQAHTAQLDDTRIAIEPDQLLAVRKEGGAWQVVHRFEPRKVTPMKRDPGLVELTSWRVRWPDEDWKPLRIPLAAYQLRPQFENPEHVIHMGLTSAAAITSVPIADWMEYEATVPLNGRAKSASLILEPTTVRGRLTVALGDKSWDADVRDEQTQPHRIDLTPALQSGSNTLRIRIHEPVPFDGVKWAVNVRVE